jgi:hypothetical protein
VRRRTKKAKGGIDVEDVFTGNILKIGMSVFRYTREDGGCVNYVRIKGDFEARITIHKGGMMIVNGMFVTMEMEAIIRHWRRYIAAMNPIANSPGGDE